MRGREPVPTQPVHFRVPVQVSIVTDADADADADHCVIRVIENHWHSVVK
jgi:hypothetical protein